MRLLEGFAWFVVAALSGMACDGSNGDSNSSGAPGGTATSGSSGSQQGGSSGAQQGGGAGVQQGGNAGSDVGGTGGNAATSGAAGRATGGSAGVGGSGGSNGGSSGSGGRGGTAGSGGSGGRGMGGSAGTGGSGSGTFACGPLMCEQGEQICHRTSPALPGGSETRVCEDFPASCSARDCSCFCNPPSRPPCGPIATCVCTGEDGRIQVVCSGA